MRNAFIREACTQISVWPSGRLRTFPDVSPLRRRRDTSADLISDNVPARFAIPVQTGRLDFVAQVRKQFSGDPTKSLSFFLTHCGLPGEDACRIGWLGSSLLLA